MTKEYLENQFKNYQDVVGTYVTPEMFGAKGDGTTDDTQAFEDAIASGKNVLCKHRATYFFNGNTVIDASAVNHCYLDLNESKLVNFHIKVGIKDGYKSGTGTAAPGWLNTVTIKNGSIGGMNWNTKMVNWETPIIQVGVNVWLEKLAIENAPYLMATVSAYRDIFVFKNILKNWNSALWTSDVLTLDAINVIKKDGTFARFNDTDINAAVSTGSGDGLAGDGWIFEGVGEWRGRANDDYAFVRFYRNQPIIIRNCIQSKFIIAKYSKASFIGCHFENPYTMPEIYNLTDATTKTLAGMAGSTQILFDTCYFYNNYVLETDYENVTYMNCYFRKAGDAADSDKNIPLADTLKNRDYYDMKCKIINSSLANYRNVDTDRFNLWKRLPKKTYNKRRKTHDSLTKIPATAADIASGSNIFPETGAYTYKTITFSNGADIANEEREWVRNIASLNSAPVSTGNMNAFNGGWRIEQYRTLPSGAIQRARFYLDPDNLDYQEGKDIFCYWALNDVGTYASLKFGILHTSSTYTEVYYALPWITVDEIPTYTVNDKIYEQNGVLNSEDLSDVPVNGDLPYFNGSRVFQKFSTLPTANATNLGRILMYTGETTSTLTHGYIYECVRDGSTYKWVQRDTQPGKSGKAVIIGDSYFDGDANYNFADHLRSKNIYEEVVDFAEGGSGFGKTYTGHQTLYEKLQDTQMRADIANADVIYMHLGGNDLLSAMPGVSHAVAEPDIYLRVQESLAEIHTINPDVTVYYIPALDYKAVQSTFICPAIAGETIPLLSGTITRIDAFKAALINFIIDIAIADSGLKVYRLDTPSCYLVEELSSDGLHPTPSAASSMFDVFINGNYNDIMLRDIVMPGSTQATITVAASVSATFLQNLETVIGSLILKRKLSKANFRFLTQITVVDQSTDYVMFVDLNGTQLSNYGYASLLPYPDSERLSFVRMTTAAGDLDMDVSNVDLRPMNENVVPTTDGTYKMKVEHVDGKLRYSWVAE